MGCGLFGKLPSKRDFIALDVPRSLLTVWEEWMQAGVAASRQELGDAWREVYLQAPIWRFWLGEEIAGAVAVGALMPSVDGVGRYFPLSALASAPEGTTLAAPTADPLDEWFQTVEAGMLAVLEDNADLDPAELAQQLPSPAFRPKPKPVPPPVRPTNNMSVWTAPGESVSGTFAHLDQLDREAVHGSRSYFWTLGGPNYRSQVITCSKLPDPLWFSGLLTGKFEARA